MDPFVRFSPLVRRGLQFRKGFERAKLVGTPDFPWYPYDSFANLFYIQRLLRMAGVSLEDVAGGGPIIDVGAGDGALSFFFESLGFDVSAIDSSATNMNRMKGINFLAKQLSSRVKIHDANLDKAEGLTEQGGVALMLGTLYHLRNPFLVLDALASRVRFCFLSTRVAEWSPDRSLRLAEAPLAYLVDELECNGDATNYWIFSRAGLLRFVKRSGWIVCASASSGARESDPVSADGDERQFLLLRSNVNI